jgi:hypothetical protein
VKTPRVSRSQLNVRIPEAMHDAITVFCDDRGISIGSLVATAVAEYIKYKPPVRKAATTRGTMTDEECKAFIAKEHTDPEWEELRRRAERAPATSPIIPKRTAVPTPKPVENPPGIGGDWMEDDGE